MLSGTEIVICAVTDLAIITSKLYGLYKLIALPALNACLTGHKIITNFEI
jgi:hypothetical protein